MGNVSRVIPNKNQVRIGKNLAGRGYKKTKWLEEMKTLTTYHFTFFNTYGILKDVEFPYYIEANKQQKIIFLLAAFPPSTQ